MIEADTQHNNMTLDWLNELEDPRIQQSMIELIRKLPEIQTTLQSVEDIVSFGKATIQDKQTTAMLEEKLSTYNVNGETLQALFTLLEKLPAMVKVIQQFEEISAFLLSIVQDKESSAYLINNLKEYADPVLQGGKNGLAFIQEVKERANCNPQSITIFSIVRWLKEPAVQKSLCYVQAAIDVLSDKKTR
ncbi:hypothetical protein [Bacillus massiliigorillae]|uniref:hypothetical protein n=1 Tax=Bacillus massiliigorillae TaxID=1243664 RepID=UPI0003A868B7|nr:hypothetical protein [Bacillus massiliigorillae]